jgi:hypothetical protein
MVLLIASVATAQTMSGRLIGRIADSAGQALPGVTVTIESEVLIGGPRAGLTDGAGEFAFVGLPPGHYLLRATLQGFVTQERTELKVDLGGATRIDIAMAEASFEGEITVVAETPVVDPTQVNTEQVFDAGYLQNSAIGSTNRGYQVVLGQAAGVDYVANASGNPSVFGSTLGENAWYMDGVNTTDPVTATWAGNFNFDSIQEIQFQTSGFEAEYGNATGGVVNLVTKSGGNSFSGTLDLRYRDNSFAESGDHFDPDEREQKYENLGATLGGPIVRDSLWFFASYESAGSEVTPDASPTTRDFQGQYGLAKLTWQIDPSWRLTGKYWTDPTDIDNADADRFHAAEATTFQEQGGELLSAELNSVLSDSWLWNTVIGINRRELNAFPQTGNLGAISHTNLITGAVSGNNSNQQYSDRDRDDLSTNLTWFVDELAGSHELKAGIELASLSLLSGNCTTGTPGGEACVPGGYGLRFDDNQLDPTDSSTVIPWVMWQDSTAGVLRYEGGQQSLFVQDAWRVHANLTLKIGVRYDQVSFDDDDGNTIVDGMGKFQPRLGFAWDITGDARNVVRASWGRFMHPSALSTPSFAKTATEPTGAWLSCSGLVGVDAAVCQQIAAANDGEWMLDPEGWDPEGWLLVPQNIFGSEPNVVDPDLDATYADEWHVSFERALWSRTSVEVTYIDKDTLDIFEDTCNGNLEGPAADAECDFYVMTNLPELRRQYRGVVARLETRSLDWLTLLASYTWSESEGNVEYTQNAGADFDVYPWHFANRYGLLEDHRKHRVKLNGYFMLPYDTTIGFDAFWSSDFHWEPQATNADGNVVPGIEAMPYDVYYVEPRGSQAGNSNYQLDLQLAKGFRAGPVRLQLIASVFNLLSDERAQSVCNRVNGCGEGEDGDIALGDAITWQVPRRYEAGVRIEF